MEISEEYNLFTPDYYSEPVFKVAEIKELINSVQTEQISFSRMVEILNEECKKHAHLEPRRRLAKMDVVRFIEAYKKTFTMDEELELSINETLRLMCNDIVKECNYILNGVLK